MGVTIWFSNGNGSNMGTITYRTPNLNFSTQSIEGHRTHLLSPPSSEELSTFALLSLPSKEFSSWTSVGCFVAEAGSEGVRTSFSLSIPGEALKAVCYEDEMPLEPALRMRRDSLLLQTFRLMILKLVTFDLLVTCLALLETWSNVTDEQMEAKPRRRVRPQTLGTSDHKEQQLIILTEKGLILTL
ncbi:pre T-cell antigen receptor alpha [Ascaphus truei]|uniref:pre T-cell antigen receptor alpha n=1 Tax=Ascaphus truei TaxID=8439 RepID=UPI003F59A77E